MLFVCRRTRATSPKDDRKRLLDAGFTKKQTDGLIDILKRIEDTGNHNRFLNSLAVILVVVMLAKDVFGA